MKNSITRPEKENGKLEWHEEQQFIILLKL